MPTSKKPSAKPSTKKPAKPSAKKSTKPESPVVPEPAPEETLPAPSTDPDIESAYTLPQLLARVGAATPAEARQLLAVSDVALVEAGKQVATPRISTDCARLYGQALDLLAHATAKQKAALLGMTPGLLRVAVYAAHHGAELYSVRQQALGQQKTRQVARQSVAEAALSRGAGRRDQLRALYLAIVGNEPTWSERIQAAYGTAKEPAELAESLSALHGLGKELLSHSDPGISERRKDSGLGAPLLEEIGKLAKDVRSLGGAAQAAREIAATSQSEVDLWDGVNLLLLERVMSLVNTAHELEPSIPRLTSIALRSYFHTPPKKRRTPAPGPTPPTA